MRSRCAPSATTGRAPLTIGSRACEPEWDEDDDWIDPETSPFPDVDLELDDEPDPDVHDFWFDPDDE